MYIKTVYVQYLRSIYDAQTKSARYSNPTVVKAKTAPRAHGVRHPNPQRF